jgi:hypothetical protein
MGVETLGEAYTSALLPAKRGGPANEFRTRGGKGIAIR